MSYLKIYEESSRDIAVADTRVRDVNSLDGSVFHSIFNREILAFQCDTPVNYPPVDYR